jgi:hypothetical protein
MGIGVITPALAAVWQAMASPFGLSLACFFFSD